MGIFGKIKSGLTWPVRITGRKAVQMKRWFWSKTIGTGIISLATAAAAALLGDPEFQGLINSTVPWALPILMIVLRLVTTGPVTR
jgi:hypothetical protein